MSDRLWLGPADAMLGPSYAKTHRGVRYNAGGDRSLVEFPWGRFWAHRRRGEAWHSRWEESAIDEVLDELDPETIGMEARI